MAVDAINYVECSVASWKSTKWRFSYSSSERLTSFILAKRVRSTEYIS